MANVIVYIRSRDFFGSQIVSYPVLYQLRTIFPDQHIRVVAQDDLGHYYQDLPWVDSYVRCDGVLNHYRQIPSEAHTIISLHHSSEQVALVSMLKRIRTRIGFQSKRIFDFSWTHSCAQTDLEYMAFANCKLLASYQDFNPQDAAKNSMLVLASSCQSRTVQPSRVVLMPGGGAGAFKRWNIHHFSTLISMLDGLLGQDTTFTVVLGESEHKEITYLQQHGNPRIRLLISRPIPEIACACTHADLIVANDCGPSHIGQSAGVPYVGIFSAPNPKWFWSRNISQAVYPLQPGAGIDSISPGQVLAACKAVLQGNIRQ